MSFHEDPDAAGRKVACTPAVTEASVRVQDPSSPRPDAEVQSPLHLGRRYDGFLPPTTFRSSDSKVCLRDAVPLS